MRKPLFKRFMISYLLMGLLPAVAFGLLFYSSNVIGLKRETRSFNFALLTQVQNRMDYLNVELRNIALHLSTRDEINRRAEDGPADATRIAEYLRSYELSVSCPATMLYYPRGENYVVLKDGRIPYRQFENSIDADDSLAFSAFFSKLNQVDQETTALVANTATQGRAEPKAWFAFLIPVPVLSPSPKGTIAFLIEKNELEKIVENYFGDMPSKVLLFNRNRQAIFSRPAFSAAEAEELFRSAKGVGVFDLKDEDGLPTIQLRTISENTDLACLMVVSPSVFYGAAMKKLNTLAVFSALLVICGFALAAALAWRSYRPIRRLLTRIGGPAACGHGENELDTLELYWRKTRTDLETQQTLVRSLVLRKFVEGTLDTAEQTDQYLRSSGIVLVHERFFVAVVRGKDAKSGEPGHQVLMETIDDFETEEAKFFAVELLAEKDLAVLVNCGAESGDVRGAAVSALWSALESSVCGGVSIGVGSSCSAKEDVHRSFIEALAALQERAGEQAGDLYFYADGAPAPDAGSAWPVIEQAVLLQALKRGDRRIAESAIGDIFAAIGRTTKDAFLIKCLHYDVINTMMKTGSAFQGSENILASFRQLPSASDAARLKEIIVSVARWICAEAAKAKEEKGAGLKNDLVRHLNEHFRDGNLSLEKVAEDFGLTPGYLSRFLKTETGFSFVHYVTILRMDYIKEHLSSTDEKIQDIIRSAGYGDVANFMRKFKIHEGVTPGQYRLMTQKN